MRTPALPSRRAALGLALAGGAALVVGGATPVLPGSLLPDADDLLGMAKWHARFRGGRAWRLSPVGVELEGQGLLNGPGAADAVLRAYAWFGREAVAAAAEYEVPLELLLDTLCVETVSGVGSRAAAAKARGSSGEVGAMQVLPSTARMALGRRGLTAQALMDPLTNLRAGAAYVAWQHAESRFDPPLVAAAYNAGGLYEERSARNPWRMRCWPIGTGGYVSKRMGFFNAALALLRRDPALAGKAPSFAALLRDRGGPVLP